MMYSGVCVCYVYLGSVCHYVWYNVFQLTKQMGGVVKGLDKVVASMDLEKVCECGV